MSDMPELGGKVSLDTTDFKTGIAELNRQTRVIESGFRAAAAGMDDWAKSADGLEKRIEALTKEVTIQEEKVRLMRAEYERIAKEQGEGSRAAQEFLVKLNKQTETLGKMQTELRQTQTSLDEYGEESDDTTKQVDKFSQAESDAETETGRLRSSLDKLKGGLQDLSSDFKGLGDKVLKGLAIGLAGIGTAAAGAIVGLSAFALKTAANADEIAESAEKLGITAEQYQEFGFIADQIGTDVESIGRAFARTTKAIAEAAKDGTPAAKMFAELGVNVKDSNGNLRKSEDVFGDIINALGKVENETQREILAQQIFGKSYQELVPLINLGADGLANMTEQAREMGAVMSEEAVNAAADLNDKLAALKAGFKGIGARLAGTFMPILTQVADKMTEWLSDTKIQKGIDNLVQRIGEFASMIGGVLESLLSGDLKGAMLKIFPPEIVDKVLEFAKAFNSLIQDTLIPFVKKHAKAIKGAFIGIAAVLGGAAIFSGIGAAIAAIASPIGILIGALALLSAAWSEDWGGIRTTITDWWETTGRPIFEKLVEWLQVNIPVAIQTLSDYWTGTLQPALATFWSWVESTVFPIIQQLIAWLAVNIPVAIQTLSEFWTGTLQPALKTFWSWVQNTVFPIIKKLYDWLAKNLPPAIKALADFWTNTLRPAIETFWNWMTTTIFPFWESFANLLSVIVVKGVEILAAIWENVLLPTLTTVYNYIKDKLQPVFDALSGFFSKTFGPALDSFRNGAWKSFQEGFGKVETIINNVKKAFDKLAEAITKFKLPAWAQRNSPSPFEQVFMGANDAIQDLQREFPKLASDMKFSMPGMGETPQAAQPAPVYVTVNANVSNDIDYYRMAQKISEEIKRGR